MNRYLIEAFLQIIILVPFAVILVKERAKDNYLRIFFFALIFIFYQIVLVLPRLSENLNFIGGNWNWDGKLFGTFFGIICYFVFRKYFNENDFFTIRQNKENFKICLIVTVASILLVTVIAYLTGSSEFSAETLAFQLTMPAIDEEIMFRGILLGLLMTALRDNIRFLGNPAVLLTAILFGFIHALSLEKDYSISFEPIYFLHTGIGGLIFGWITLKSRSILLALLAHGFANFLAALVTMHK
ncbi:MAG TPA: CPBP family intramembrane metalloprotease [Pyrinomonadaceae bacterium]|nr:CPBP family intramembrane metalloprotease [Pyrinomonadaceae bacterium]